MDERLTNAIELLTKAQKHLSDESELFHRIMFFLDTVYDDTEGKLSE